MNFATIFFSVLYHIITNLFFENYRCRLVNSHNLRKFEINLLPTQFVYYRFSEFSQNTESRQSRYWVTDNSLSPAIKRFFKPFNLYFLVYSILRDLVAIKHKRCLKLTFIARIPDNLFNESISQKISCCVDLQISISSPCDFVHFFFDCCIVTNSNHKNINTCNIVFEEKSESENDKLRKDFFQHAMTV